MVAKLLGGQASLFVTRRVTIHNGVVAFRGSTKQADHGGGKRRVAIHFCLFFAAAGGADRTSAHGSEFCFASGRLLIVDS